MKNTKKRLGIAEQFLLHCIDELAETHPIIPVLSKYGIIVNYDEIGALEALGRTYSGISQNVQLTICPTMNCNFDCIYCYEDHIPGYMSKETQDDVIALADKMLKASHAPMLSINWFGGEPLLAVDIIDSMSKKLINVAKDNNAGFEASIITNGYLLDENAVNVLKNSQISLIQITIDGLNDTHNKTRYLKGGGTTFDRIIENISRKNLPFKINIRHNVHNENKDEMKKLEDYINALSTDTGNDITYYPYPVFNSDTAEKKGHQIKLLSKDDACAVDLKFYSKANNAVCGHYCKASNIWAVTIDTTGNLLKCSEIVNDKGLVFGNVHTWNPKKPLESAEKPDNYIMYINSALPLLDQECRSCVWLPICNGGCPRYRLFQKKKCVAFKDSPREYIHSLLVD